MRIWRVRISAAPRPTDRLVVPGPIILKASGTSSQSEIRTMIPVENPIPIAIMRGFSPRVMASEAPMSVVPPDRTARAITEM
jgi:hypothetical protein